MHKDDFVEGNEGSMIMIIKGLVRYCTCHFLNINEISIVLPSIHSIKISLVSLAIDFYQTMLFPWLG